MEITGDLALKAIEGVAMDEGKHEYMTIGVGVAVEQCDAVLASVKDMALLISGFIRLL